MRRIPMPILAAILLAAHPATTRAQPSSPNVPKIILPGQKPITVQPIPINLQPGQPIVADPNEPEPRMVLGLPLILPVRTMTFNPAGDKLYTLIGDKTHAWDLATGKHEEILKNLVGSHLTFAFGPGTKLVAIQALDRTVQVVDMETGKVRITLDGKIPTTKNHPSDEPRLALSADGEFVIATGHDSEVMHWDGKTGKLLKTWYSYPRFSGKALRASDMIMSPDGKQVAVAVHNYGKGEIKFATTDGRLLPNTLHIKSGVWKIAYSADSNLLAAGLSNGSVQVWQVDPPKLKQTLTGHQGKVTAVVFTPDGKRLYSGDENGTIHGWKLDDGTKEQTWATNEAEIGPMAVTDDGKRLAWFGRHGELRVVDLASGNNVLLALGHTASAGNVLSSPDGKYLVSAGGHGVMRLWDVKTGKSLAGFSRGKNFFSSDMYFTPDGKTLLVEMAQDLHVWDMETRKWRRSLQIGHHMMRSVAVSPNGKTVAVGGYKGTTLWDLATGEQLLNWPQEMQVRCVHFTPDGKEVLTALVSNEIQRLDIENKKALRPLDLANPPKTWNPGAFSPDGKRVALGAGFSPIIVWDVATGKQVAQAKGIGSLNNIAFSPDGKLIAAADQNRILVWEAATGKQRALFVKNSQGVMRVAFIGNTAIAGANQKNRILVWDLPK